MGVNDSPKAKNHPTPGAKPADLPDDRTGGNKHTTTGGGQDQFSSSRNAASRDAAAHDGIESGTPGANSSEAGSGEEIRSGTPDGSRRKG